MEYMKEVIKNIQNDDQLLFTYDPRPLNEDIKKYLEFYHLPSKNITYSYGYEKAASERLFIQSFRPLKVKANILLLHGYYDHAGILGRAIRFFVGQGFHVLTFDLPGHGLSSGKRAVITDFSFYRDSVREIVHKHLSPSPFPVYSVSHSTGAGAVIDHLLNSEDRSPIEKAAFIGPLIRSYRWEVTTFGMKPLMMVTPELRRVFRSNSSDTNFLRFIKQDPLQHNKVPLRWLEALMKWNESLKERTPSLTPILVIQGKKDTTVDWRYNIALLQKKFPNIDVQLIKNGKHHLLNEKEPIRDQVFSSIHNFFEKV